MPRRPCTLLAFLALPALAAAEPLDQLIARHGTLSGGGLTFSGFDVNPVPFSHPQGAVVNDGADLDVSVVSFNGHTALRFTGIDPATGLPRPIVADSDVGPRNLLRNAAYTVATARPGETFHAVHQRLGPGSRSIGDLTVALLSYDLDTAGLLLEHIFTGLGGGATIADAVLPTGLDGATFMHFGDELELASSHGGHHVASATIDWYEIAFETVSSCPADFNADGFVDFFDYDAFIDCYETGACPPGASADFNMDGFADFFDYDAFVASYEQGC